MDLFVDYKNWKEEKEELLHELKHHDSAIIQRYLPVIQVLDHLYNLAINKKHKLSEDEEVIFSIGFEYLDNNFITIEELLKNSFNNDFHKMNNNAKAVNLLLYTMDFEDEVMNQSEDKDDSIKDDLDKLSKFEDEVMSYIKSGKDMPDGMFVKLDDLTEDIFARHKLEMNPIDSIFYEIAETYGLIEVDYDIYNEVVNEMIKRDHEGENN